MILQKALIVEVGWIRVDGDEDLVSIWWGGWKFLLPHEVQPTEFEEHAAVNDQACLVSDGKTVWLHDLGRPALLVGRANGSTARQVVDEYVRIAGWTILELENLSGPPYDVAMMR